MSFFKKLNKSYPKLPRRHQWLIFLLLGGAALLFEVIEHRGVNNPLDAHFVREILFFSVIYPITFVLLLNLLLHIQNEHNTITQQKGWEKRLQQELRMANNWDEMVNSIVHFPRIVAPVSGISLLRYHPIENAFERVAELWWPEISKDIWEETADSSSPCGVLNHVMGQRLHPFTSKIFFTTGLHGYCLPLWSNDRFIGLLHLYLPATEQFSVEQAGLFNHLAPVIAQALETATPENPDFLYAAAARQERKRVARQLHGTLAQNLSYLRLKLEQLALDDGLRNNPVVGQELERLLEVANEAYGQVRNALIALQHDNPNSLVDELLVMAQQTAGRADFTLHRQVQGDARPVPPVTQHEILSIFREALANVEQHAWATNVYLTVIRSKTCLTVCLEDDGIGFDPTKSAGVGNLGLRIMARRAEELPGQLSVQSEPEQGTKITLQYPLTEIQETVTVMVRQPENILS